MHTDTTLFESTV